MNKSLKGLFETQQDKPDLTEPPVDAPRIVFTIARATVSPSPIVKINFINIY